MNGAKHHSHTTVRADHQARKHMSPLGGGQPDPYTLSRDEDIASAPMKRGRDMPDTNRSGGITPIKGRFPTAQNMR